MDVDLLTVNCEALGGQRSKANRWLQSNTARAAAKSPALKMTNNEVGFLKSRLEFGKVSCAEEKKRKDEIIMPQSRIFEFENMGRDAPSIVRIDGLF